jgi:hypothetical protein
VSDFRWEWIDGVRGAETHRHRTTCGEGVHPDDDRRAAQFRPKRRAEPDRALCEDRNGITQLHVAAFGAGNSRRRDIGHHQHLFVAELVRNPGEVGARVRHQQVLGPGAVDGVAKPPSAERAATLRARIVETIKTLAAWRNRTNDDPLAHLILVIKPFAERIDDADWFVAKDQTRPDRVLAFDDVDVGAADGGCGNPDDCLARARTWLRYFLQPQVIDAAEHNSFHGVHYYLLCRNAWQGSWNS